MFIVSFNYLAIGILQIFEIKLESELFAIKKRMFAPKSNQKKQRLK